MPNITVQTALWIPRRRRHHHESGMQVIFSQTFSLPYSNPRSQPPMPPADGARPIFLFWSIIGAMSGPMVLADENPILSIPYEDHDNVIATAWYTELGIGTGLSEYNIDAFDVNSGNFINSEVDFVIVGPDRNLSVEANREGVVPTRTREDIHANFDVNNEQFIDWKTWMIFQGQILSNTANDLNLSAPANTNAIAFAFYGIPVGGPRDLRIPGPIRFKP